MDQSFRLVLLVLTVKRQTLLFQLLLAVLINIMSQIIRHPITTEVDQKLLYLLKNYDSNYLQNKFLYNNCCIYNY